MAYLFTLFNVTFLSVSYLTISIFLQSYFDYVSCNTFTFIVFIYFIFINIFVNDSLLISI